MQDFGRRGQYFFIFILHSYALSYEGLDLKQDFILYLLKSSPEDLNIVDMDERMLKTEKKINLFEAMNESLTDRIDICVNSLQVQVEDNERVITNKNIRQSGLVSSKQNNASAKTKGAAKLLHNLQVHLQQNQSRRIQSRL